MITVAHVKLVPPEAGIYIGRVMPGQEALTGPTRGFWGNPFRRAQHGESAGPLYTAWLLDSLEPQARLVRGRAGMFLPDDVFRCWCHPKRCHGDVLKAFIEGDRETLKLARMADWWRKLTRGHKKKDQTEEQFDLFKKGG